MQGRVIVVLVGLLIIALGLYFLLTALAPEGAPSSFRGPVGEPYVKGPTGPPPSP